ncbi:MAG TPA: hypothetical protein VGN59_17055 [Acidimicrobiia bacterium]|jgi:hypothetical protein
MMKRSLIVGGAAAIVTVALGAGIVYAATSGSDDEAAPARARTHRATTTTTWEKATTSTTTTTTTPATASGAGSATPGAGAPPASTPSTPAATSPASAVSDDASDPPDPSYAYQPVRLPAGVSGTVTSCTWSPGNGGELRASGTVTNTAGADDVWLISAVWLQHNQTQDEEIDYQTDVIDLAVGQSTTWNLTTSATSAPPTLSCAFEVE